jgi:hypothetical protein
MSRKRKLLWGVIVGLGVILAGVLSLMISTHVALANERRTAFVSAAIKQTLLLLNDNRRIISVI